MNDEKFLIIGLGQFGMSLLETFLRHTDSDNLLVIDRNEEKIKLIQDRVNNALIFDSTNSEMLKKLELENFNTAVISIRNDFKTILFISVLLKELGIKKVIARAASEFEGRILKKTGTDIVIFPEAEMGKKTAEMLLNKNFSNTINLTGENTVCTIKTPEMLIGKSLQQSKLRKKYGINILAVKTGNEKDNMYIPDARYKLKSDDVLILTGNTHKIEIFLYNINK